MPEMPEIAGSRPRARLRCALRCSSGPPLTPCARRDAVCCWLSSWLNAPNLSSSPRGRSVQDVAYVRCVHALRRLHHIAGAHPSTEMYDDRMT